METKKAAWWLELLGLAPKIIDSATTIIEEKTRDSDGSVIKDKMKGGKIFSSRRVLNIGGTFAIITIASADISKNGITKENLILTAIGVAFAVLMSYLTNKNDKKTSK